jgi:gamma-F420-2:alpha-L-glutamate ligase
MIGGSMTGWVIYTDYATRLSPERYELNRFIEVAKEEDIDLLVVQPEQVDLLITNEKVQRIFVDGIPKDPPDFVLPRMGAGTTYQALSLIRHFEKTGVFVLNSTKSIELTKDKLYTQQTLVENGIPAPKTMFMKFPVDVDLVERHLHFPVVVKTVTGSQGNGVFLSRNKRSFRNLMLLLDAVNRHTDVIVQEFISTSAGYDVRILAIDGNVVACMERHSGDGDFKANISMGGTAVRYKVTPEIEKITMQVSNALDLNVAGIDLLFGEDRFYVCEASSSPGFRGMESCCGVNVAKKIFDFIKHTITK